MENLSSCIVPLPTAFTDDGSQVSEIRMARLIRRLRDSSPGGWIVASEVGEFNALSNTERKELLEIVVREVGSGMRVWCHVSCGSTSASLDLAQHADRHGAGGALLMPPPYGSFTDAEMLDYYHTVARHAGLQVIAFDPLAKMSGTLAAQIKEITGLCVPDVVRTEAANLTIDGLLSHPLHAIGLESTKHGTLASIAERVGPAKFVKAALEELDFEVGPLRGPLQALMGDPRAELRAALG